MNKYVAFLELEGDIYYFSPNGDPKGRTFFKDFDHAFRYTDAYVAHQEALYFSQGGGDDDPEIKVLVIDERHPMIRRQP